MAPHPIVSPEDFLAYSLGFIFVIMLWALPFYLDYLFGNGEFIDKLPDGIFGEFLFFGYFLGSIVLAHFLGDYFF